MIHYIEYDPATGEGREIDPFKSPDLVAVVRCRDCVHFANWDGVKEFPWCVLHGIAVKPDGFCAWGERRTDDN